MLQLKPEDLPNYTYEDFKHWEGKWELIEGVPYAKVPMPSLRHQRIVNKIGWLLEEALKDCPYCIPFQPVDWKISENTVFEPDVLVVCVEEKGDIYALLDQPYLDRPPILIFEVLSPSTEKKDRFLKPRFYAAEGVKYLVLIDPQKGLGEVFELKEEKYCLREKIAKEGVFDFDLGPCQLSFDFGKIFS